MVPDIAWEAMYAPHDQATYQAVLDQLQPAEIVLDIGSGDLRLSRQMARKVQKVYAVEINIELLENARTSCDPLPANLTPVCANARTWEFPSDVTTGVLMMRHCTCFRLYAEKLQQAGAARLITNARWRMNVEVIDLLLQRKPFAEAGMGWYACACGRTGFKEGPVEHWSLEMDNTVNEVSSCPQCMQV